MTLNSSSYHQTVLAKRRNEMMEGKDPFTLNYAGYFLRIFFSKVGVSQKYLKIIIIVSPSPSHTIIRGFSLLLTLSLLVIKRVVKTVVVFFVLRKTLEIFFSAFELPKMAGNSQIIIFTTNHQRCVGILDFCVVSHHNDPLQLTNYLLI